MEKFLMICYVAADFGPYEGEMFRVTPTMIGTFIEAPIWVKGTILFKWLCNDGSIKVAEQQITKKQGENDPMQGMSAEGKNIEVSEKNEAEVTKAVETPEASAETPEVAPGDAPEVPVEKPAKPAKKKATKTKKDDAK